MKEVYIYIYILVLKYAQRSIAYGFVVFQFNLLCFFTVDDSFKQFNPFNYDVRYPNCSLTDHHCIFFLFFCFSFIDFLFFLFLLSYFKYVAFYIVSSFLLLRTARSIRRKMFGVIWSTEIFYFYFFFIIVSLFIKWHL